jgi:hypothetical protein
MALLTNVVILLENLQNFPSLGTIKLMIHNNMKGSNLYIRTKYLHKMIMDVWYNIGYFTSYLIHFIGLVQVRFLLPFGRPEQNFSTLHVLLSAGFSTTRDLCVPGNGIAHPESCSTSSTGFGRPRALFWIWNSLFRI